MIDIKIGIAAGIVKNRHHQHLSDFAKLVDSITFGSFTNGKKVGNKEPVFWYDDNTETSINAVGLANEGLLHFLNDDLPPIVELFKRIGCKIRVSLAPLKIGDLEEMVEMLLECPLLDHIVEIEINAACPNHRDASGLHPVLAHDPDSIRELLHEAKSLTCRKALKLAPDTEIEVLSKIIALCVQGNTETIVSANTRLSSSMIEGEQRLSVDMGGIAGTPLLESGLIQMSVLDEIVENTATLGLNFIGCGGILHAKAAHAYAHAGATDLQVATLPHKFGARGVLGLLVNLHA